MKNWIARLLGGAGHPAPDGAPAPAAPAASPASPDARADAAGLDQRFWQWLCDLPAGDHSLEPAGPAARMVLDELARLAHAPGEAADLVPRVPEVITRLLRSLRSDEVSGAELAREVLRDPVLVAEVIREANSPFYRPAKPVRTVDAALLVLGQNGLRMLLARVAFRPIMNAASGRLARQAAPRLWLHSERCALACSLLAPPLGADPFEGYLSGLMLDVGLVVAFRLADQLLDAGHAPSKPPPQDPALVSALLTGARQLSARIALHWELPPIGAAILAAGASGAQPLARALAEADRLARLRLLLEHGVLAASDPLLANLDGASARVFERLTLEPG